MGDDSEIEQVRAFWNRIAADWRIQVGTDGDVNRRLNSDPVLWDLLGDVRELRVLDAGCGTGYLTAKLAERGARVTGTDLSDAMIEIARRDHPDLEFYVDSSSELRTQSDRSFDRVVSNYMLMDTPDLHGTMRTFARVLRPGGAVVLVFSHPCFPQGSATVSADAREISYRWTTSYFEPARRVDPPWNHFTSEFIWYHRPLSGYWQAFSEAGFAVTAFEEPHITPELYAEAPGARTLMGSRMRPYSVAFRLEKRGEQTR